MKRVLSIFCILFATDILLLAASASGAVLLHEKAVCGPDPRTETKEYRVDLTNPNARIGISLEGRVKSGKGTFKVTGPAGENLLEKSSGKATIQLGKVFGPFSQAGTLLIVLSLDDAVGDWEVAAVQIPERESLYLNLATGPLMVLVALFFVAAWFVRTRVKLRWFLMGAAIWTVGVALKFALAIAANGPILAFLEAHLPRVAYVAAGSVYIGLLTGVFEIGVTLIFALIWHKMALDGQRAVAVGVGAGSFEAFLLGIVGFASILSVVLKPDAMELQLVGLSYIGALTPAMWLLGPAERILAILCHISSRTLVLYAVATRRWSYFWYGFLLMTALDGMAGVLYVGNLLGSFSIWWVELALLPFAIVSIPIVLWCVTHWPTAPIPPLADEKAFGNNP